MRKILLFVLVSYIPIQPMAWGLSGHRIVGEIADSYLSAKARIQIKKILGNESVAMASNWADFIKSDPAYRYLNNWHYIDFKKDITFTEMKEKVASDTGTNVYTKINFLIKELKSSRLSHNNQVMYLRLLIHLVGDVHQPLHASATGTVGGNQVKVLWFDMPSNLHRVWDEQLVQFQELSYTEYTRAINHTTVAARKALQNDKPVLWLYESFQISNQLQDEIKKPEQNLGYQYNFQHIQTLNQQLVKGGVRLAGILNGIFGG